MSQLEFVAHYHEMEARLLAFAIRLTNDEADARDLLQETAYKAFKYRNLYQPHTNLRAWLMTIMRNTFINDYRKARRRQMLSGRPEHSLSLQARNRSEGNLGETNLALEELHHIVQQLESWARIPFLLHYQGYKYEEIAQELDLPLGTVKSRIFFARRRLKEMIHEFYNSRPPLSCS